MSEITQEMVMQVWMYVCSAIVTGQVAWKGVKFVGWKKDVMFAMTRHLAKESGWTAGLFMWPALVADLVLSPVYLWVAFTGGTIEKRFKVKAEKEAEERVKSHMRYFESVIDDMRDDIVRTQEDIQGLCRVWLK